LLRQSPEARPPHGIRDAPVFWGPSRARPARILADWLDTITEALDELPGSEEEFIAAQLAMADPTKFLPAEYGL
jgi:lysophospholipase L1-like esterase